MHVPPSATSFRRRDCFGLLPSCCVLEADRRCCGDETELSSAWGASGAFTKREDAASTRQRRRPFTIS